MATPQQGRTRKAVQPEQLKECTGCKDLRERLDEQRQAIEELVHIVKRLKAIVL